MGYITGWIVVGIITLGIYKLFELFVGKKERLTMISRMIKVELPTRSKGPFLRFQRPLRFLMRLVVRLAISPRSLLVSYLNLRWIYRMVRVFTFVKN